MLRMLRDEDKYPRKLLVLGFGNSGFIEITYVKKNRGDKDRRGKDLMGKRPRGERIIAENTWM